LMIEFTTLPASQGKHLFFPENEPDGACDSDLQVLPQVSGSLIDDAVISLFVLLFGNSCTEDTEFSFVQPGVAFSEVLVAFSVAVPYDLNVPVRFKVPESLGVFRDLLVHLRGDAEPVPKTFTNIQNFWIPYFSEDADDGRCVKDLHALPLKVIKVRL